MYSLFQFYSFSPPFLQCFILCLSVCSDFWDINICLLCVCCLFLSLLPFQFRFVPVIVVLFKNFDTSVIISLFYRAFFLSSSWLKNILILNNLPFSRFWSRVLSLFFSLESTLVKFFYLSFALFRASVCLAVCYPLSFSCFLPTLTFVFLLCWWVLFCLALFFFEVDKIKGWIPPDVGWIEKEEWNWERRGNEEAIVTNYSRRVLRHCHWSPTNFIQVFYSHFSYFYPSSISSTHTLVLVVNNKIISG